MVGQVVQDSFAVNGPASNPQSTTGLRKYLLVYEGRVWTLVYSWCWAFHLYLMGLWRQACAMSYCQALIYPRYWAFHLYFLWGCSDELAWRANGGPLMLKTEYSSSRASPSEPTSPAIVSSIPLLRPNIPVRSIVSLHPLIPSHFYDLIVKLHMDDTKLSTTATGKANLIGIQKVWPQIGTTC